MNSNKSHIQPHHSLNTEHQSTMPSTNSKSSSNPNNGLKHQLKMQQPMHQLQGCLTSPTLLQGWWNQETSLASLETSHKAWTEGMPSTTGPDHSTINRHCSPKDIHKQLHSSPTKQKHTDSLNTMACSDTPHQRCSGSRRAKKSSFRKKRLNALNARKK